METGGGALTRGSSTGILLTFCTPFLLLSHRFAPSGWFCFISPLTNSPEIHTETQDDPRGVALTPAKRERDPMASAATHKHLSYGDTPKVRMLGPERRGKQGFNTVSPFLIVSSGIKSSDR